MNPPRLDLHCHTVYSDGDDTVAATVAKARAAGLDFVAVTDHDYFNADAYGALKTAGVATCQAMEISTRDEEAGHSLHVLAYAEKFSDEILSLMAVGRERNGLWEKRLDDLARRGFHASYAGMTAWKKERGIGLMMDGTRHARGYVWDDPFNRQAARELARAEDARRAQAGESPLSPELATLPEAKYLSKLLWAAGAALEKPELRMPHPAVGLAKWAAAARRSGALLSVAHPNFSFKKFGGPEGWAARLDRYAALGIGGVELNPFAGPEWVAAIREQSERRGLVVTFGSDSHGPRDATHGELGELHPEAERDPAWCGKHVKKFLEAVGAEERTRTMAG